MKLLYIDLETTGISAMIHGIIQISAIVEIDGVVKQRFQRFMKPFPSDEVDDEALKIVGLTREQFEAFEDPIDVQKDFISMLSKYVNRFNNTSDDEYFTLVTYCDPFDYNFIVEWFRKNRPEVIDEGIYCNIFEEVLNGGGRIKDKLTWLDEWLKKNGNRFIHSYINKKFDVYNLFVMMRKHLKNPPIKSNLETVCDYFGININAHDANSDIEATRQLYHHLTGSLSVKKNILNSKARRV